MRRGRIMVRPADGALAVFTIIIAFATGGARAAANRLPEPLRDATAVAAADLPGFSQDDHRSALATFRHSCPATSATASAPEGLVTACQAASRLRPRPTEAAARTFFKRHFTAYKITVPAFFTGYYEPVVEGSLVRTAAFTVPLRAPPPGLVPGGANAIGSIRRADGMLTPLPDRAAIETGALDGMARPLVWVRHPVDAFFIQVQGSSRIRLPDGSIRRIAFAARNGYPYTSIGKVLVDTLGIPPAQMGMADLRAWIEAHGQGATDAGTALMRHNRSYIFFRFDGTLPRHAGPVGAAGVSLTPLRTIAIDHTLWPYGIPFYLSADLPWQAGSATPLRRLAVAQDTGAAIKGPARADIFFGTGAAAADRAGVIRHPGTLYVLWPNATAAAAP